MTGEGDGGANPRQAAAHVPPRFEAVARRCPVCDSIGGPAIEANLDLGRLDRFSFASRKVPEYMHHRLVACPVCDTLYADPAPTERVLRDEYARAAYDSGEAARFAAVTYATLLPRVLRAAPHEGGAIDVGAGDGAFLRELRAAGLTDVTGVEPSVAAVEAAAPDVRDLIRREAFRADRFESGSFRLVTAFQTLEHVLDPLALCREACELLRPGGALFVVCHDRRALVNRLLGRRSPIFDVEHLQLFSGQSVRTLLERSGLSDVELHSLVNRYPLRSWARLVPMPDGFKRSLLSALDGRLGAIPLPLPAGNFAAIGYRPDPRTAAQT